MVRSSLRWRKGWLGASRGAFREVSEVLPEFREEVAMNERRMRVLALLAALALALGVGAVTGGGLVYALTRLGGSAVPVAKAQMTDPGYGIVIASVLEDGPAEKAGVVRGDILLEIDGREMEGPSDLRRMLDDLAPGDEVLAHLTTGGRHFGMKVDETLTER